LQLVVSLLSSTDDAPDLHSFPTRRSSDLNRLLRIVSGQLGTAATQGLRQDSILIAKNLGPAELLEYDRRRLKGVVLEEGSLTARSEEHTSELQSRENLVCRLLLEKKKKD